MAILVAAAGAFAGNALGIGASYGWLAGSFIGNMLFPKDGPNVKGPRLGDLSVMSAAYGRPIPIAYGTIVLPGNVIWVEGNQIKERKRTRSTSVGKGGGSGSSTTYQYYATMGIAFGEGEAADLLRIWADGKLIYDKTASNPDVAKVGLNFRFYPGSEDQIADPAIVAEKGAANTPAFRGLCYAVFEELPLADFGNRVPNITAEIAYNATNNVDLDVTTSYSGGSFDTATINSLAVDFRRQYAYRLDVSGNGTTCGLRRYNIRTMAQDRQVGAGSMALTIETSPYQFNGACFVAPDGSIIFNSQDDNTDRMPIVRLDPNNYQEAARFGTASISPSMGTAGFSVLKTGGCCFATVYGLNGTEDYFVAVTKTGKLGLLKLPDLDYVWDQSTADIDLPIAVSNVYSAVEGARGDGVTEVFLLCGPDYVSDSASDVEIWRMLITYGASYEQVDGSATFGGVTLELLDTLSITDLVPGAANLETVTHPVYDAVDGGLIMMSQEGGSGARDVVVSKWRDGEGIVWQATPAQQISMNGNLGSAWGVQQSRLEHGTYGFLLSTSAVLLDTATGEILLEQSGWGTSPDRTRVWDSASESVVFESGTHVYRAWLRRSTGLAADLGVVVTDLCERSGLSASDLDVTDLTGTDLPGYAITRAGSARNAIEQLASVFFFDGVESDYTLKFITRGQSSARSLTESDLVDPGAGKSVLTERRQQEVELPLSFSIVYMDKDEDYNNVVAAAKRIGNPDTAVSSKNNIRLEMPAALESDMAKQAAEKGLFSAWIERVSYDFGLSWEHIDLDPADVVTVTMDDGTVYTPRLSQLDLGANMMIDAAGLAQEAAQYTSTVTASAGSGHVAQTVPSSELTKLFILDAPLLRDADEAPSRAYVPTYCFMSGYTEGWAAGTLYKSTDGTDYSVEGAVASPAAWGTTGNALADVSNPFRTDTVNTLTVYMVSGGGDLASITSTQLLNGLNAAALRNSNGEIEVIQFQNVTDNGDGSYTLDTLLRGRRGTDVFTGGHEVGEDFILLDSNDGEVFDLDTSEVGSARYFKGVGNGALIEDEVAYTLSSNGRALQPYAPVHGAGNLSGSDIVISWTRRTRVGGVVDLENIGGEVPLAEDSESYEVDILDSSGGSVLRTLTSSTDSVTYTAAQITTDFGATPTTLYVRIYQISAQVDRGFSYEHELEIS